MLKVVNLTRIFTMGLFKRRYIYAVNNVSFEIKSGEIVSLVGESGSGKTTTAKIILRLLPPTSGKVLFEGKDVWRDYKGSTLKEYYRNVQGIFQDPYASYNPLYKVRRIIYQVFNLMNESLSDEEKYRLASNALRAVGLNPEEVLDKYPHELSGGQRQRLMIARCYLLKPKLILADEPTSMIDACSRGIVIKLLNELRDEYKTSVLFITHDLGLAYYISDRILIMYKGRIIETGTPDEVISHPQHEYTKALVESVPLLYKKWSDFT